MWPILSNLPFRRAEGIDESDVADEARFRVAKATDESQGLVQGQANPAAVDGFLEEWEELGQGFRPELDICV